MKKVRFLASMIVLSCVLSFSSCGTMNLGSKLKNVEIGMTKKEVTNILGNSYDVVAARDTPDGPLEVLRYTGVTIDGDKYYIVNFLNGKLVEWFLETGRLPHP
ncbi:hypothetical protein GGR21_002884 [Dysgonomonas hofstadii]|uniref:Lipoprotein SmpA/OmlA domain-containing protein n=1 Tax=Dysgonomonas hofstadii TaxID=637886 RepID=A0A840CLV0_9BACT|nr:hypothetical protein [Dysgonomonas hofstadii]MBB4036970.1 hypothetical protein [Dysgonomonas hofstadii]